MHSSELIASSHNCRLLSSVFVFFWTCQPKIRNFDELFFCPQNASAVDFFTLQTSLPTIKVRRGKLICETDIFEIHEFCIGILGFQNFVPSFSHKTFPYCHGTIGSHLAPKW